ncbi:MAG: nicotinate-nucleotide adenylyltransferase [Deltaproteobacteria bacterium]|nr:nicotinate-nucleotide adenylyltransferase [Deltaproteobacteria bacterium]
MQNSVQRIGLLGGTFDPIHFGHLRAAVEVREALMLHEVWFVVAAFPPHKACSTPFHHRQAMVELAIREHKGFECIDIEAERHGPSYSIDTLRLLNQKKPGGKPGRVSSSYEFFFVLGVDQFQEITSWKEYGRLLDYAHLVVIDRGVERDAAKRAALRVMDGVFSNYRPCDDAMTRFVCDNGKDIYLLHVTRLDISSSMIRERLKTGHAVDFLTERSVIEYMNANNFYKIAGVYEED